MSDKITIYCDGACSGNQFDENYGGWGAVIKYKEHTKEIYGGQCNTTNQVMELVSCIRALETLTKSNISVEVYSDSAYLINCFNQKWYIKWWKNGWKNSQRKPVENKELWIKLLELKDKFSDISFHHIKGHSGVELNELADQLAQRGINELRD